MSPAPTSHPIAAALGPRLIEPGDGSYDAIRALWNGMIDHRPAAIARVQSADEAALALGLARERGLAVSIRGGGHNAAGLAVGDGSLVIDLSEMTAVTVDPERRRARVQGGARWRDVDAAAQAHGLATPGGVVSDTGVAGLTLSGGLGWLRRERGLACDSLVSAEVVTADGRTLRASDTKHPDLFWAIRGGGGNFGVVTEFEFELHPLGPIVATTVAIYPIAGAAARLRELRTLAPSLPDIASPLLVLTPVPDDPAFPAEVRGGDALFVLSLASGPVEAGLELLAPLARLGPGAVADIGGPTPYVEWQQFFDADYPAHTMRYYWKSSYADDLPDEVIDRLVDLFNRRPSRHSTIDLWPNLGAIARVPAGATAYDKRSAAWLVSPESNWEDPTEDAVNIAWGRAVVDVIGGDAYLNFPGLLEDGEAEVRGSHGEAFDRLARVKRTYDPDNTFRFNANVPPAAA
jgi:FAD/FMN-containing dehydrogenase